MKASITQEKIAKALSYVSKAISTNPSIPVLSNVLIEVADGQLTFSTTDLEFGVNVVIGAETKGEGKVTVNAKTLSEFVNSLPSGKINLVEKEKVLTVENSSSSADFNVISADEFPPLPKPTGKPDFKVNGNIFTKGIEQVIISSATDDSRPVLTGILFEATNRRLSMVGVDSYRLSRKVIDIERIGAGEFKHVVPAKTLSEVARIARDLCEEKDFVDVYLLKDKNQMIFKINNVEVSTRLIEGEFPEYQQILPKDASYKFSVDKDSFAKTVKVVSIFARSAIGNKAIFEFIPAKNLLKLSAQVADVGENESNVEVYDVQGENLKTAFNTSFLNDVISVIEGEEIIFETNGATAPGVFKDKDDKDLLHIIMPMRLD